MFDVFLCHNNLDQPAVEQLALRLQSNGLIPLLDAWHLIPGRPWQPALEGALADCQTVAVFLGPSGVSPWHNEAMRLALDHAARRNDEYRVLPVLLPGATPDGVTGFLGQRTWVDFRGGLDGEVAFARLVAAIKGQVPTADTSPLPDEPTPYRGLRPFEKAHSAYFFGREAETRLVLKKLRRDSFVAVVGPSGAGKSSLMLGGVLPRLEAEPGLRSFVRIMRPGARPLRALAEQLATLVPEEHRLEQVDALHARLTKGANGFRTAVMILTEEQPGRFILAVDQLEELLTHASGTEAPGEVDAFLANMRDAILNGHGAIRILATLRADFFGRCIGHPALRELLQDRQALLGGMGEEALRDVIVRPARLAGAYLEQGLVSAILADMPREPGALPLLADALDGLWRARSGACLTLAAYEASGVVARSLGRRARACYEALKPEEQDVAKRLLIRLTRLGEDTGDTRQRVARAELSFPGVAATRVEHVLQVLSSPEARLLILDADTVELAHDVLLRGWPSLRAWLDEERRH